MTLVLAYQGKDVVVLATDLLCKYFGQTLEDLGWSDLQLSNNSKFEMRLEEKLWQSPNKTHYLVVAGIQSALNRLLLHAATLDGLIDSREPPNMVQAYGLSVYADFDFTVLDPAKPQLYFRRFSKGEDIIKVPEDTFYTFGVINSWMQEHPFKALKPEEIADGFVDSLRELAPVFKTIDGHAAYIIREGKVTPHSISI